MYNFEVLGFMLEYFHFMLLHISTSLHFQREIYFYLGAGVILKITIKYMMSL